MQTKATSVLCARYAYFCVVVRICVRSIGGGFYQTISQPVVLMDSAKRFVKIGENRVYDQSFIFARVSELIHSSRDISMEDCLKTELAQYPPAYFDEDGKMRSTTKSTLTSSLAERVLERRMHICDSLTLEHNMATRRKSSQNIHLSF